MDQHPFFRDVYVVVSEWRFEVWNTILESESAVFTGCLGTFDVSYTGWGWHLALPGVFVLSKSNGTVDVWDLSEETVFGPVQAVSLTQFEIHSMKFLNRNKENQAVHLAVGDSSGRLPLFDVSKTSDDAQEHQLKRLRKLFSRDISSMRL